MAQRKVLRKNVTYKQAKFHGEGKTGTLKTRLYQALLLLKTCGDRRFNVGGQDEPCFLINTPIKESNKSGFIFGTLITFTPGKDPLFIIDDEGAAELSIEKIKAKLTDDGKRREFLESIIYFGVKGNHVALLQSLALKATHLEQYFNWLLNKSGANSSGQRIILSDSPPPKLAERIKIGRGVREINIVGNVMACDPTSNNIGSTFDLFKTKIEEKGLSKVLKDFVKESSDSEIDFERLHESRIQMSISLKYSGDDNNDGQILMDSLGAVFRNVEDVDTILKLEDGHTIKGSEIKVNGPVSIGSYSGQLAEFEAYEALRNWLLQTLNEKLD